MDNLTLLIDTLHTLLCNKPHSGKVEDLMNNRQEDKCYYYVEKSVSTWQELPDHTHWTMQAKMMMRELKTQDANSALTSIYRVLDFVEKFNQLNEAEQNLALRFLNDDDEDD